MRSKALFALPVLVFVVACGGGGSSGGGSNPIPSGPTPTPGPTATPGPGATPTPAPTPTPSPTPTPGPVTDSTAAAYTLTDDPNKALGDPTTIGTFPNTGRSSSTAVDGINCGSPGSAQHFHGHISVFDNGKQIVVPAGIGMFQPHVALGTYFEEPGTTGCAYDVHTHSDEAVIHVESSSATQAYNLQQFFDLWGQPLTANGFGPFAGTTRVFVTDESSGAAGSYTVTEVTGQNLTAIPLSRHFEYTVEVGPTFVPIPNYVWGGGL